MEFESPVKSDADDEVTLPFDLLIECKRSNGTVSTRTITVYSVLDSGSDPKLRAYCHLRQEELNFRVGQIIKATQVGTNREIDFTGNIYPYAGTDNELWWITAERLGIQKDASNHEQVRAAVRYAGCVYKALKGSMPIPGDMQKSAIQGILSDKNLLDYVVKWAKRVFSRGTVYPRLVRNEYFASVATWYGIR